MSKKTIIFTSITFIIVVLLIISTFIWDYKELVLLKDLSLVGALSFSLIKTLNISATFNRYKTTIKEINIYNHLNNSENSTIKKMDKNTFDKVYNVYAKLSNYFSNRDMSFAIPNDLFTDLMLLLDYDAKQPDFKLSKKRTDDALSRLIDASNEFILYLLANTFDYNNHYKVTKRKELINKGKGPDEFNQYETEENNLNELLKRMLLEYKNLIDSFYKEYTPQSSNK